ncbi:integration host factor subunit alpha [Moraxella macacae 0408225]|uniref:Integration host factor subunit alpha n=1 Tax=Moraxella macacae 0408225 TaxID=1230338 RepID=L2FBB7_9GAMM|nr:integration host factor subunit alpha [Moraxella macacae]ELA09733.1 integration host factor subunit alpha [Moraxella macacae 0408225]
MNTSDTLTKSEMVQYLINQLPMTRQEGRLFVESFFGVLSESLTAGYQVKLSGFGNFELKQKNQRPGRNPKTGEMVAISARRVVTFKAGQKMRQRVARTLF